MPTRSLSSPVLRWPDRKTVVAALEAWAAQEAPKHAGLVRLGYFGSYARGDWGVGSDLDLVAVVKDSPEPFERRALGWNLASLPVPTELLVYTLAEWESLLASGSRFARMLQTECVWLPVDGGEAPPHSSSDFKYS